VFGFNIIVLAFISLVHAMHRIGHTIVKQSMNDRIVVSRREHRNEDMEAAELSSTKHGVSAAEHAPTECQEENDGSE
jgi:hypothetical protein